MRRHHQVYKSARYVRAQRIMCTTQASVMNVVIGVLVVLCELHVIVRVHVSFLVHAVVGLTLGLIAHVVVVVFFVAILHRIFCIWRKTLYTLSRFWTVARRVLRRRRLASETSLDRRPQTQRPNDCLAPVRGCWRTQAARLRLPFAAAKSSLHPK